MVQWKNTQRLGWAAAALTAVALMSGCSHSDPAAVAPPSAPAAMAPAAVPAASTAAPGAPRDPHVSPMSPEDQADMKQNDEKNKALGAPP